MTIQALSTNISNTRIINLDNSKINEKSAPVKDSFINEWDIVPQQAFNINIPAASAVVVAESFANGVTDIIKAPGKLVTELANFTQIDQNSWWDKINGAVQVGAQVVCSPLTISAGLVWGTCSGMAKAVQIIALAAQD